MADTASCRWDGLLPELLARIASMLPPNEVACTLCLVNKLTRKHIKGWVSVRLSQPVPHHAFVWRWGDESGARGLTFKQRQQLLCLTARSGVIANLEVAVAAMGCGLTHQVLDAAAEGGHVVVCVWLLDRGCPRIFEVAIGCAVRGGHTAVVRWLLEQSPGLASEALIAAAGACQRALCEELLAAGAGPECIKNAAFRAADGGHVELTGWLLGQLAQPSDASDGGLLQYAAYGFELPALQRLYHSRLGSEASAEFREAHGARLAAAALASPTPDWRAKLEWLEAVGCRLGQCQILDDIMKRGDAMGRVVLLQERGQLDAPICLLLAGALADRTLITAIAVGDLAVLAELLAAGGRIGQHAVHMAARCGHLHVLRWLEGPEAGPAAAVALEEAMEGRKLFEHGARSGSLELMEWLWERGCPSDERVFTGAAKAGNMALLEQLVARDCPMSCDAYLKAGRNGDLATLHCLRRLDCPWGPDCDTFDRAVYDYGGQRCSLEVLRLLVAEGCPVDWQSARVRARRLGVAAEVLAWIEDHIPQA